MSEGDLMAVIRHATWHDEFDRCPGCGHATVGIGKPYCIEHAEDCDVAEFIARTTNHPGAVEERDRYREALEEIASDLGTPGKAEWRCAMEALGLDADAAERAWHS